MANRLYAPPAVKGLKHKNASVILSTSGRSFNVPYVPSLTAQGNHSTCFKPFTTTWVQFYGRSRDAYNRHDKPLHH